MTCKLATPPADADRAVESAAAVLTLLVAALALLAAAVLLCRGDTSAAAVAATTALMLLSYTPDVPPAASYDRLSSPQHSELWPLSCAGQLTKVHATQAHVRRWKREEPCGRIHDGRRRHLVVCLHGTFTSSHEFESWAHALQHESSNDKGCCPFEVLGLDLPGHGLTGPWQTAGDELPYSVGADVDFLRRLLEEMGATGLPLTLVGHSLGGAVAAAYAARHPQSIKSLVLMAPWGLSHGVGDPATQHCTWFVKFALSPRWRFLSFWLCLLMIRVTPRPLLRYALGTAFGRGAPAAGEPQPSKVLVEAAVDRLHAAMLREGNRRTFITRISHMVAEGRQAGHAQYVRFCVELSRISCPVQVQWGEADSWLPCGRCAAWTKAFKALGPAVDVRLWPGVGHCLPEQTPQRSAAAAWTLISKTIQG